MDLTTRGIPHYYGDTIRALFFTVVIIGFVAVPVWGDLLPLGLTAEVLGGLILVIIAGFLNPNNTWPITLSIIASAAGAFLLEVTAIAYRHENPLLLFIAREISVLLLVAALYFGVKTLRAIMQGKLGVTPTPEEFN